VRTIIYDGDADYICNYIGVESMVSPPCFVLNRFFRAFVLIRSLHTVRRFLR
jgi:hypothetical protein